MRVFGALWVGQLVTLLGSSASAFALSLWIYQDSGSVTYFAIGLLVAYLPSVLVAPLAGSVVDRYDLRRVMLTGMLVSAAAMTTVAVAVGTGSLTRWHVYGFDVVHSLVTAFQMSALTAVVPRLVSRTSLARANGLTQLAFGAAQICGPPLATTLIAVSGLRTVIALDLLSYGIAMVTLLAVRFPGPTPRSSDAAAPPRLVDDLGVGWRFIAARPGLLGVLLFVAVVNFVTGAVTVLITPLVLAVASQQTLGMISATGGVGMVCGALAMSAWAPRRRLVPLICGAGAAAGAVVVGAGIRPTVTTITVGAFCFFLALPVISSSSQTLWHLRVPADLHGRVYATRLAVAQASVPLAYAVTGPLAELAGGHIPALLTGAGITVAVAAAVCFTRSAVRELEQESTTYA
ncbi:MFS transporter [Micromonospora sp. NPDC000089]|uniref:MFS transporter n=1 Tax=unclassified Micromonospora TaxID=2617518 RepID=UPI0036AD3DDA